MGDLLIRNIEDGLKRQLQDSARRHGRSLSDEAILQIRKALAMRATDGRKPGDRLQELIGGAQFSSDEIAAMESFRKETGREPPAFE